MVIKTTSGNIYIGKDALRSLNAFLKKSDYSQYYIICDENTLLHCLPSLINHCPALSDAEIFELDPGEQSKTLQTCEQLWQTLIDFKADKKILVVNLGGGMISDLGGFVASLYKRGVNFINIPTSLLAMVDASIGGKNGVDHANVKNVIGTIQAPSAVFIHPGFLATLPIREFQNGMAEVFKIALIADKGFWEEISEAPNKKIDYVLAKSVKLKNQIVTKDPLEKGIRKSLNFGHTIGHALESALLHSEQPLLHGEAVLIGMLCESWLAWKKKLISNQAFTEIMEVLVSRFKPARHIDQKEHALAADFILNDKKNKDDKILFALPAPVGKCKFGIPATLDLIAQSVEFYNSLLK
jgi:3-dehydroquinate synthase